MMVLLRALTRLLGAVWMVAIGLLGLGVVLYCLDALISLGSARPDRLVNLPAVRDWVGRFLQRLAASGSTASLALLCGLGAMLLGVLLLAGTLRSRRQSLAVLEQDSSTGMIGARPRALREMTRTLAEQAGGVTAVKRPKLSLSRRGTRGRLTINGARARTNDSSDVKQALKQAVAPVSEPFGLNTRVRVRLGQRGQRVR